MINFAGPSLMDFGQVCLRSVSSKDLTIVNNLDIFIHVVVEVSISSFFYSVTPHYRVKSY